MGIIYFKVKVPSVLNCNIKKNLILVTVFKYLVAEKMVA